MSELPVEEREVDAMRSARRKAWEKSAYNTPNAFEREKYEITFRSGWDAGAKWAALAAREEPPDDGDPSHTRQAQYDAIVKLQDELAVARSRLAAREVEKLPPTDSQRAKIEQELVNEQVRLMQRTGSCPCCGKDYR